MFVWNGVIRYKYVILLTWMKHIDSTLFLCFSTHIKQIESTVFLWWGYSLRSIFSFSASSRPLSPPNPLSVSLTTPYGYPKKRRSMCWPLSSSNPHVPPACLIYFSTMWYIYFVGMAAVTLDRTTMCYNWPITLASLIADVFFMRMGVAISLRDMFGDLIK